MPYKITFDMEKPAECGDQGCVCFCNQPLATSNITGQTAGVVTERAVHISCQDIRCQKGQEFGNLDVSPATYSEWQFKDTGGQLVEKPKCKNGFFIFRGPMKYDARDRSSNIATIPIMKGSFGVTLEKVVDGDKAMVAVCSRQIDGHCFYTAS